MTPSLDCAAKTQTTNVSTDVVFILSIFNAITTAIMFISMVGLLVMDVVLENYKIDPSSIPLPMNRECVILLAALHIVALGLTVDLLRNLLRLSKKSLIRRYSVTIMVSLVGTTLTIGYLIIIGPRIEGLVQILGFIYALPLIAAFAYTKLIKAHDKTGYGNINKLLAQDSEKFTKRRIEVL